MTRRDFLAASAVVGISTSIDAKAVSIEIRELKAVEATIAAVQQHMFPEKSKLPSANAMDTITFLKETVTHPSYDKDIRRFVIEGAQELEMRTRGKFVSMDSSQKEKALRSYEKTSYGRSWLARIMTLTMEAIFSDPIYGSNIAQAGWKAVESFGGVPRPKQRYIWE